MGPTVDTPAMCESDVELTGASVASASDGHMSRETGDTNNEAGKPGSSDDAPSDIIGCYPSLDADAVGIGATDDKTPALGTRFPEQSTADKPSRGRRGRRTPETHSLSSSPESDILTPSKSPGSCTSSDSEATIIAPDSEHTLSDVKLAAEPFLKMPRPSPLTTRPNPLNFLEPDSPAITPESIRRSIEASTSRWKSTRPVRESRSERSSDPGFSAHSMFSRTDPETTRSSVLDHGSPRPRQGLLHLNNIRDPKGYGASGIYAGPAAYPHIPAQTIPPALPARSGQDIEAPHAVNPPTSGYHLLASHLTSGHPSSPILPIYRRFETLAHRVLLHVQDELSELEEQLLRLEATDTEARRAQGCIPPASRRADSILGGEMQWHRTDILGKIGYKLEQYNRVLASLVKTQRLAAPSESETEEYISFLETHKPVAEPETRFLDFSDDLVVLRGYDPNDYLSSGASTPVPIADTPLPSVLETQTKTPKAPAPLTPPRHDLPSPSLVTAIAITILLPLVSFASIGSLPARAAVIWIVALGVLNPLLRARGLRGATVGSRGALSWAGVYGGAMSFIAVLVS